MQIQSSHQLSEGFRCFSCRSETHLNSEKLRKRKKSDFLPESAPNAGETRNTAQPSADLDHVIAAVNTSIKVGRPSAACSTLETTRFIFTPSHVVTSLRDHRADGLQCLASFCSDKFVMLLHPALSRQLGVHISIRKACYCLVLSTH